jgi:hypothetical protein
MEFIVSEVVNKPVYGRVEMRQNSDVEMNLVWESVISVHYNEHSIRDPACNEHGEDNKECFGQFE